MNKYDKMTIRILYKDGIRQTLTKRITGGEEFLDPKKEIKEVQEKMKNRWADFDQLENGQVIGSISVKTRDVLFYEINFDSITKKKELIELDKKIEKEFKKSRENLTDKLSLTKLFNIK